MTKAKLVSEIIAAPAAVVAAPATQPLVITITEPTHVGFAAAASLIRSGWVISPDFPPEVFASTGHSTITMVRGNPDAHSVAIATAAEAHAVACHQRDFDKEVAAAAARIVAEAEKAKKQAEIAVVIAEQQAQIAKLTAEMAAQQ